MNIEKKINVLTKIAKELNKESITWAIGGSLLLYIKGITTEFNDIDIVVDETDIQKVKDIIIKFGKLLSINMQYETKYFLEFIAEDVEIDVISGLTITNKGKKYYFPLKKDNISDNTIINGVYIPLQTVEEWRKYYGLMNRIDKVEIIDKFYNIKQ